MTPKPSPFAQLTLNGPTMEDVPNAADIGGGTGNRSSRVSPGQAEQGEDPPAYRRSPELLDPYLDYVAAKIASEAVPAPR